MAHTTPVTFHRPKHIMLAALLLSSIASSSAFTLPHQCHFDFQIMHKDGSSWIKSRSSPPAARASIALAATPINKFHSDDFFNADTNIMNSPENQQSITKSISTAAIIGILPFLGWNASPHPAESSQPFTFFPPPAANALQEKNEALCNTGFFTNVGAWYCTDIGNIGDEGKSKPLAGKEEASVDSLLSKFDLGASGSDNNEDSKEETNETAASNAGRK